MNFIRQLLANKKDNEGRKVVTVFFMNVFLILVHFFLMFIYIYIKNYMMIFINILSLLYYCGFIKKCIYKSDLYIGFTFCEIWVHMICATLSFGWGPCYQNWSYAILTASFLPAFNSENYVRDNRLALFFTIIVIFTYFGLWLLCNVFETIIIYPLTNTINIVLFIFNNVISFLTIMLFAYFYTSNKTRKENELTRKADFDELTNLYNRYAINQISKHIIDDAKNSNKPYNVAILDIDFFKEVNDNYGHTSGDMVLVELAKILKNTCKGKIISGRWGGEEFVILADHNVRYYEFVNMLKRLKNKIIKNKFIIENGQKIDLTVSIGACSIKNFDSLEKAISKADSNLYIAKNNGRNKIVS